MRVKMRTKITINQNTWTIFTIVLIAGVRPLLPLPAIIEDIFSFCSHTMPKFSMNISRWRQLADFITYYAANIRDMCAMNKHMRFFKHRY